LDESLIQKQNRLGGGGNDEIRDATLTSIVRPADKKKPTLKATRRF